MKFQNDVQRQYPVDSFEENEDNIRDKSCSLTADGFDGSGRHSLKFAVFLICTCSLAVLVPGGSKSSNTIFQKDFKATEKGFVRQKVSRKRVKAEEDAEEIAEADACNSQLLDLPDF